MQISRMQITVWYKDADGKKQPHLGDVVAGSQQHIRAFTVLFPGDEEEYPVQKWSSVDDDPDFDEWHYGDYNTDPAAYERMRERVSRLVRGPMSRTSRSDKVEWRRLLTLSQAQKGEPGYASGKGASKAKSNAKRPKEADEAYVGSATERAAVKRLKASHDEWVGSATQRATVRSNAG